MEYETKILDVILYICSTLDKIFNRTLKCELDLTILFKYWKFPLNFGIILFT